MRECPNEDADDLVAFMQNKTSKGTQPVVIPGSYSSDDAFLRDSRMEQMHEVLRVSMVDSSYSSEDGYIIELLTFLFRDPVVIVTLGNCARFL